MKSDIRVERATVEFEYLNCRTPIKFGAVVMPGGTFATARVTVSNREGRTAEGSGGVLLADFWAYPSRTHHHPERDRMMCEATELYRALLEGDKDYGHPLDIAAELEPELRGIGRKIEASFGMTEEFPLLAVLVSMSPLDGALHDAFGKVNGIDTYAGYGREHMSYDLSRRLGPSFAGRYPGDYLRPAFKPKVPLFHLVGGLDKLTRAELDDKDPHDGLPVSLDEWIAKEGLYCLKVKLVGNDLGWDLNRIIGVDTVAREVLGPERSGRLAYSVDTNEQCDNPAYCVELLRKLKAERPQAFDAVLYVEQPTERDLGAHRHDMRELGAIKPVIIDESLTEQSAFDLAVELGWTGIALKTGKGHSASLLFLAQAEERGMPYTVQDLSLPKLAYLHSLGFAARIDTLMGVEGNGRQYHPFASDRERRLHAAAFDPAAGEVSTASLKGPGLGFGFDGLPRGGQSV